MANTRVTAANADVLSRGDASVQITNAYVEALSPGDASVQITNAYVEALSPGDASVQITNAYVEALSPGDASVQITNAVLEVLTPGKPTVRVSSAVVEVLRTIVLPEDSSLDASFGLDVAISATLADGQLTAEVESGFGIGAEIRGTTFSFSNSVDERLFYGHRWYGGFGFLGGSDRQVLLAGATAVAGSHMVVNGALGILGAPVTAAGGSRATAQPLTPPTELKPTPPPLVGTARAFITSAEFEVKAEGALIVYTFPGKSTTDRDQYGRTARVVL
jgi:hypothetical protein